MGLVALVAHGSYIRLPNVARTSSAILGPAWNDLHDRLTLLVLALLLATVELEELEEEGVKMKSGSGEKALNTSVCHDCTDNTSRRSGLRCIISSSLTLKAPGYGGWRPLGLSNSMSTSNQG
jgi:hypothetical protein